MDVSIIVPLKDEEESLPELCTWIKRVVDEHRYSYEVILVDDGSADQSWEVIQQLSNQNPHIKGIKF
ncbi:MAG: glycosyltransferase, partial [Sphingobacteriales bacterium]